MKFPFPADGSLKVGSPAIKRGRTALEAVQPTGIAEAPSQAAVDPKPYLARLVILVPAEVISLYVAMKPVAEDFLPWFGAVCLALVVLVRMKATSENGKPEWGGVVISSVSFALWVYSSGGSLPWIPIPADAGIVAVAIAVWTFAVPYFYQGGPSSTPST